MEQLGIGYRWGYVKVNGMRFEGGAFCQEFCYCHTAPSRRLLCYSQERGAGGYLMTGDEIHGQFFAFE